jgi:hypothetical protein
LITISIVNYFGNPAQTFNSEYESKIADFLSQGKYVTNIRNHDERVLQKKIADFTSKKLDILVLGSSRTKQIRDSLFDGLTLLNCSVNGARLEDLIGIYQIFDDQHKLPKRIIIGIDPWTLKPKEEEERWESISEYVAKFNQSSNKYSFTKITQLLSLSYFRSSLDELLEKNEKYEYPIPTTKKYNKNHTKLTDGSLVYSNFHRNISSKDRNKNINNYLLNGIYGIEDFSQASIQRIELLKRLFKEFNANQISFQVFLAPYPPTVYDFLIERNYSVVFETENLIRKLAEEYDFRIYGSYNPYSMNFDDSYFIDGYHCAEKGVYEIILNGAK